MTTNLNDLIARLEREHAALGDVRDVINTPRAQEAFHNKHWDLARTISALRDTGLDKPLAQLADVEARRAAVVEKHSDLTKQLTDAPSLEALTNARDRDREHDRQMHLQRQLQRLHDGTLLCAPGVAYDRLDDLDARSAELNAKIATLRARLAAHVEQAEALLAETVAR